MRGDHEQQARCGATSRRSSGSPGIGSNSGGEDAFARSRFCALLDLGFPPVFDPLASRSERSHPGGRFLDQRAWSHNAHHRA